MLNLRTVKMQMAEYAEKSDFPTEEIKYKRLVLKGIACVMELALLGDETNKPLLWHGVEVHEDEFHPLIDLWAIELSGFIEYVNDISSAQRISNAVDTSLEVIKYNGASVLLGIIESRTDYPEEFKVIHRGRVGDALACAMLSNQIHTTFRNSLGYSIRKVLGADPAIRPIMMSRLLLLHIMESRTMAIQSGFDIDYKSFATEAITVCKEYTLMTEIPDKYK